MAAFVEVPLAPGSEPYALEDYRGSLINRETIDEKLEALPREVRKEVARWLRDGPDAEFLRLTEADEDRLLIRADFCDKSAAQIWNSRVPRRGLARVALEREADRLESRRPDSPGST